MVDRARQLFNLTDDPEPPERANPGIDMPFQRRLLYIPNFHIDANLINAKQKLDDVNRLERWAEDGVILINMSWTAHAESQADGNPYRMKKAAKQLFTMDTGDAEANSRPRSALRSFQMARTMKISETMCGSMRGDQVARHPCHRRRCIKVATRRHPWQQEQAAGSRRRRDPVSDEAVAFVATNIKERDTFEQGGSSQDFGKPLPDWTDRTEFAHLRVPRPSWLPTSAER